MVDRHQLFSLFEKKIFERVVLTPPFRLPAKMPNEACFYYAVLGDSHFKTSRGPLALRAEEAVVLKCGNYINEWVESKPSSTCEIIAVHFYPEVLKKVYDKELPDFMLRVGEIDPLPLKKSKSDELMHNYITSLQFYFENQQLVSEELLKLKLKELILLLAKTDNAELISDLIASMFSPHELSIKEVVEANLYSNLSIEEFAHLSSKSVSIFKREFVKIYKQSPARYIREQKLKRASELLLKTEQRISDIAFNSGFAEVAHFSKSFHKHFEISPKNYRMTRIDKKLV